MGPVTDRDWLAHAAAAFARRAGDDLIAFVVDRPEGEAWPGRQRSGPDFISPALAQQS
jgi:hypothetical protein